MYMVVSVTNGLQGNPGSPFGCEFEEEVDKILRRQTHPEFLIVVHHVRVTAAGYSNEQMGSEPPTWIIFLFSAFISLHPGKDHQKSFPHCAVTN